MEKRILELIGEKGEATLSDLYAALPEYPRHSVRSKASILVKKGLLRKAGKGVYALSEGTPCEPAAADTSIQAGADTRENDSTEKDDVSPETISRDDLRERILRLLRRQPDATPEELAEVLEVDKDTVRSIIGELIDQGELEPPSEGEAATPAEERNIRSTKCFYAPICRNTPGMRRVCEVRGSLLCVQQKTARGATVAS